ncbi:MULTISPECIES: FadR/GntR family transcriptional regulator [Mycolicibacterium]|jgi:DNA-binding FadR family transcriptional regulator|uniref:GntR family transcriptional regulator n=3 Tax=Mycolicibacterium TaxID=1866885 RepID=A0A378SXY8_9MYCO|nr:MULTISPECIES: FCD domain-containing protein [Mycolicibacterium]KLI08328.1 hypothetical protein AA982_10335 [Mycolicibacterium senegalense]KLO48880.1 hypothetical protein ABW05_30235 [Mycolicibacterium senegalense]KMV17024.1 hypothetical protein ACT17_17995 [Mycolicibacterium conceptionense]MCV7337817.1 FadR family transcriptional regulator [Mycolicibacterium senegalense]MCW1822935.1 FCD domain-containing protein [Mycolicibacterium senegalense]
MLDALERVVDEIMRSATRTADGEIARLPTERQLAETLGISRGALREQLAALESLGLVTRTQGSGIHLAASSPTAVRLFFDLSVRLGLITTDQLERGREMLEETVVRAAAIRATPADLAELEDYVEQMVTGSAAGDHAGADAADYNFHRCLYRIVDNPVLNLIADGLVDVLRELLSQRRIRAITSEKPDEHGHFRTDLIHRQIVGALRLRDPDLAAATMAAHFEQWRHITDLPSDLPATG